MIQGSPAADASEKFISLARTIFPKQPRRQTRFGQYWDLFRNWQADGRYDSGILDTTLEKAFGHRRLFDVASPLPSGHGVAVTASHIDEDGSLCLFSNYRLSGRAEEQVSYRLIAPQEPDDEPLLWQVSVLPLVVVSSWGRWRRHLSSSEPW
jgi:hypothetical protein